jgi:dolichyl-phosphate beta-glucosyltransferase
VRLSVVVPAYKEERIGETLAALREGLEKVAADGGVELIVVDDGSHDGTAELAEAGGADVVIRQPVNRGKGSAVRTGMLAARGRTVAFTDADLSYSPDQLIDLLHEVEDGWDVVVGSRRHTDAVQLVREGRLREVGSRGINLLTKVVLLGEHRDTQCGLKAFRSDVARLIFSHSHVDGFAFDVEVFHLVERYGLSLREVPVRVKNQSRSTVHVVRDAARLVRDLFRIRSWDLQGVYTPDPSEMLAAAPELCVEGDTPTAPSAP